MYKRQTYADRAIGRWAGFTIGWLYWYFWALLMGWEAYVAGQILHGWFPMAPAWGYALLVTVSLLVVNFLNVDVYKRQIPGCCRWWPIPCATGSGHMAWTASACLLYTSYRGVHPDYGTVADVRRLIRAAHARGLRVITELVVNHTSDQHPWFQRARTSRPGSAARNFYVWSDNDKAYAGTRVIFCDTEKSNWTWDPVANAYFWHRFYSHQPDLNYDCLLYTSRCV